MKNTRVCPCRHRWICSEPKGSFRSTIVAPPSCRNFRVPARTKHAKLGPSAGRDPAYKLASTTKGTVPSIRCKACSESRPRKSNACVVSEIERLSAAGGLWRLDEIASCRNPECANHGRSIARHPEAYRKRGRRASGNGRYFQCKACGRKRLAAADIQGRARRFQSLVAGSMDVAKATAVSGVLASDALSEGWSRGYASRGRRCQATPTFTR